MKCQAQGSALQQNLSWGAPALLSSRWLRQAAGFCWVTCPALRKEPGAASKRCWWAVVSLRPPTSDSCIFSPMCKLVQVWRAGAVSLAIYQGKFMGANASQEHMTTGLEKEGRSERKHWCNGNIHSQCSSMRKLARIHALTCISGYRSTNICCKNMLPAHRHMFHRGVVGELPPQLHRPWAEPEQAQGPPAPPVGGRGLCTHCSAAPSQHCLRFFDSHTLYGLTRLGYPRGKRTLNRHQPQRLCYLSPDQ